MLTDSFRALSRLVLFAVANDPTDPPPDGDGNGGGGGGNDEPTKPPPDAE